MYDVHLDLLHLIAWLGRFADAGQWVAMAGLFADRVVVDRTQVVGGDV